MAERPYTLSREPPKSPPQPAMEPTQRAYKLRLSGLNKDDNSWREKLWETHKAINKGAQVFGDWLLTMKGGLSYELASQEKDNTERQNKMKMLSLSWFSVESKEGAPKQLIIERAAEHNKPYHNDCKVIKELESLLKRTRLRNDEITMWLSVCKDSLMARIRDDAVWVNRHGAFQNLTDGMKFQESDARNVLTDFFGDIHDFLVIPKVDDSSENTERGKGNASANDEKFSNLARGWLSNHWGSGEKSDKDSIVKNLRKVLGLNLEKQAGNTGAKVISYIAEELKANLESNDLVKEISRAIGWKGSPTGSHRAIKKLSRTETVSSEDIKVFREKIQEEITKKETEKEKASSSKTPHWMPAMKQYLEKAIGIDFRVGRDLIGEFSVMLDHALRHVSAAHSWIKKAEGARSKFEEKIAKLDEIKKTNSEAVIWLDSYCENRSIRSGSKGGYLIQKRAIVGWNELVKKWASKSCKTLDDRINAIKILQDESEKFGDPKLFEDLADESAKCVWLTKEGKPDPEILKNYSSAKKAESDKRRFKIPAYRHPDHLRHPVFCEFGESRWRVDFDIHKSLKRKRIPENPWGVQLTVYNGSGLEKLKLRWQSKLLFNDLAIRAKLSENASQAKTETQKLSRANRLGRAVPNLDNVDLADIIGVFNDKEWNGRLQLSRDELNAIARLEEKGKHPSAEKSIKRLKWYLTFSPKLRPQGPWYSYACKNGFKYLPHVHENKKRGRLAKLGLCRLPGLRVLSVDLGHRHAACCAVWEAISARQLKELRSAHHIKTVHEDDLCCHLESARNGRKKKLIFRRIGSDKLPDGSTHPAPWARLERQFIIKLQGEDEPSRAATPEEKQAAAEFERQVGVANSEMERHPKIDEFMFKVISTARSALARHGKLAKIAYTMKSTIKQMPGGKTKELTENEYVQELLNALIDWKDLNPDNKRWEDPKVQQLWQKYINIYLPKQSDNETSKERKSREQKWRENLLPAAQKLAKNKEVRLMLSNELADIWKERDGKPAIVDQKTGKRKSAATGWHKIIRWLGDWVLPRYKTFKSDKTDVINVGGLGLTRIASIKRLYQLAKAFKMRPTPDDPTENTPAEGDSSLTNHARRFSVALDKLRDNRVKQLASRIIEAALGIGKEQSRMAKDVKRPRTRVFDPCHAVVVENLEYYKPDEIRTRRENRQLMEWSAAKVKKYLSEACELYGVFLQEISAKYTSRQDSRSGQPGIRCTDTTVKKFLSSQYWTKAVEKATGKTDSLSRYLVDLKQFANQAIKDKPGHVLRIPREGGEIFVSSDDKSPAVKGLHADLNAAANIGLRALADPDWPGRWWYVLCDSESYTPAEELKGSNAIDTTKPLLHYQQKTKKSNTKFYLWRDPSIKPVDSDNGPWKVNEEYWNGVRTKVIKILRHQIGLDDAATVEIHRKFTE